VAAGSRFVGDLTFRNPSGGTVEIRRVELEIVEPAADSETWPASSPVPAPVTEGRRIVVLEGGNQRVTVVPPEEAFELPPAAAVSLPLDVEPPDPSLRGRGFAVRLAVEWVVPGKTAVLERRRLRPIEMSEGSDAGRSGG